MTNIDNIILKLLHKQEERIDNMKCCENCKNTGCSTAATSYCSDWKFDELTKEERTEL